MDNLISNGAVFSFSEFSALIKENSIDAVHDSIAQLSDSNGFFRILELGEIKLSWDDNASTLCNYDGEDYYIMEFLDLVKNLSNNEILQRDKQQNYLRDDLLSYDNLKNEIYDTFKKEKNIVKITEQLGLDDIDIAVYDKNDRLISLIYKKDNFDDSKDVVWKNDELSYVSEIVHIIQENYGDVGAESLVEGGVNYIADIIMLDRKNQNKDKEQESNSLDLTKKIHLDKIVEQYENSLKKDTSSIESKELSYEQEKTEVQKTKTNRQG